MVLYKSFVKLSNGGFYIVCNDGKIEQRLAVGCISYFYSLPYPRGCAWVELLNRQLVSCHVSIIHEQPEDQHFIFVWVGPTLKSSPALTKEYIWGREDLAGGTAFILITKLIFLETFCTALIDVDAARKEFHSDNCPITASSRTGEILFGCNIVSMAMARDCLPRLWGILQGYCNSKNPPGNLESCLPITETISQGNWETIPLLDCKNSEDLSEEELQEIFEIKAGGDWTSLDELTI